MKFRQETFGVCLNSLFKDCMKEGKVGISSLYPKYVIHKTKKGNILNS